MILRKLTLFIIVSLFMSKALAQELFVKKGLFSSFESVPMTPMQPLSERSTAGDYPIPSVDAELRHGFLLTYSSTGTAQLPMGRVFAVSERNNIHYISIDMRVNLGLGNISDWVNEPCKRDDFLWKRSVGASYTQQNCASLSHIVNYFVAPTGEFQTLLGYIKNEGVQIPPTVIRAVFTRYAPGGKWLTYAIDVNPEQFGVNRDASTPWGSNSWHPQFIGRDPQKVWFIEGMKRWAIDIQDRMDRAFEKDRNAFSNLRPLSEYFLSQAGVSATSRTTAVKSASLIEDEVAALKRLLEKELITESQFNEQVKMLLQGK